MRSLRASTLVLIATSSVAALVAASCGSSSSPGGGGPDGGGSGADASPVSADAYQACLDRTNMYRGTLSLAALAKGGSALQTYADTGASYDYAHTPHAHFGLTPVGGGIAFAENECPHWDISFSKDGTEAGLVSACIDAFWSEGPGTGDAHGHYNNMIGNYKTLACGIYHQGSDYTILQDYGN